MKYLIGAAILASTAAFCIWVGLGAEEANKARQECREGVLAQCEEKDWGPEQCLAQLCLICYQQCPS